MEESGATYQQAALGWALEDYRHRGRNLLDRTPIQKVAETWRFKPGDKPKLLCFRWYSLCSSQMME